MKQIILCVVSFGAGLTIGSSIRFSQYWRAGYRQGSVVTTNELHCEAVREGHAHWERVDESVQFRWNDVRTNYAPNSPSRIPGLE